MSDLRDRIINAIWDDLIVQRDSDIPFAPSVSRSDSYIDGEVDIESVADAVIRELNLAEACEGGCMWQIPNRFEDMTPQQRELLERSDDE